MLKNFAKTLETFREIVKEFRQMFVFGDPPRPSDAISIESNGISNRSNRKSQKSSNDRKIARMARILTIFGRNRFVLARSIFSKFSKKRKIIESIESIDSIGRSTDRLDRST